MKSSIASFAALLFVSFGPGSSAQSTATPPPVPSQISSAHSAFLGYAGAPPERNAQESVQFVYSGLYDALVKDGHYKLTATTNNADIAIEFSILVQNSDVAFGSSTSTPGIRLRLIDPQTHLTLWTLTEPVDTALRKVSAQQHIQATITTLISQLDDLIAGKFPAAQKK